MIHLADIALARYRITPHLLPTPIELASGLGSQTYLKLENANKTHSFKVRGALNALLALRPEDRARGIVTTSSGNHAQGVAYAAHLTGANARILMPVHTPRRKVAGVQRYGAEAVLFGETYDDAEAEGRRIQHTEGLTFVSPYNDPNVVAGAGTIGMEIVESLPTVERVIVPVSGGGLISGIAVAVKALRPHCEIIGVNAANAPAMYNAFYDTGHPQVWETLAEALSGEIEAGSITLDIAPRYVDKIVMVSEEAIAEAMRWLLREQGWIAEGGGAVGIAALLSGAIERSDAPTAVVISGGNIDYDALQRLINIR